MMSWEEKLKALEQIRVLQMERKRMEALHGRGTWSWPYSIWRKQFKGDMHLMNPYDEKYLIEELEKMENDQG